METTSRRAFTLIELLTTIAIIAIVASILFPVLAKSKRMAKGSVEISNMRQVYIALMMYEEDNQERSPMTLGELLNYTTTDQILSSPLDTLRNPMANGTWTATPFIPCSGLLYRDKISYGYLRQFTPYDTEPDRWREVRANSTIGILASPWRGDPTSSFSGSLSCGDQVLSIAGPIMSGPIQRIQMDGSLYLLKAHRDKGAFGASMNDLFFNR